MTMDDLICPECGYDLRAIESNRCPECGQVLDREMLSRSSIPWSYRHEIGHWRAYWRTVALAIRRPARLAAEIGRPVDFEDAKKFRRVTALIAAIVPMLTIVALYIATIDQRGPLSFGGVFGRMVQPTGAPLPAMYVLGWLMEYLLVAVTCAAVWLFLFATAGAASYFFHPAALPMTRQNRAVALSYYACAPLALTPGSLSFVLALLVAAHKDWFMFKALMAPLSIVMALAFVLVAFQSLATYIVPLRILARTTHCGAARVIALAAALPAMWALLGALILLGIPAAVAFVSLVVLSLAP